MAVATDSVQIRIYMGCCNAYDPNLFNNGSLPKIKYKKIDNGGHFWVLHRLYLYIDVLINYYQLSLKCRRAAGPKCITKFFILQTIV